MRNLKIRQHDFARAWALVGARRKRCGNWLAEAKRPTFHGVTEKELGDSILRRLRTLAQLRSRPDEVGVGSPIHVFGGLDPLLTPYILLPAPNSSTGLHGFDTRFWMG